MRLPTVLLRVSLGLRWREEPPDAAVPARNVPSGPNPTDTASEELPGPLRGLMEKIEQQVVPQYNAREAAVFDQHSANLRDAFKVYGLDTTRRDVWATAAVLSYWLAAVAEAWPAGSPQAEAIYGAARTVAMNARTWSRTPGTEG